MVVVHGVGCLESLARVASCNGLPHEQTARHIPTCWRTGICNLLSLSVIFVIRRFKCRSEVVMRGISCMLFRCDNGRWFLTKRKACQSQVWFPVSTTLRGSYENITIEKLLEILLKAKQRPACGSKLRSEVDSFGPVAHNSDGAKFGVII